MDYEDNVIRSLYTYSMSVMSTHTKEIQ